MGSLNRVQIPQMIIFFETNDQLSVLPSINSSTNFNLLTILTFIYFSGCVFILIRLVYQAIYLRAMGDLSRSTCKDGLNIVLVDKDIMPFSYLRKIFIPREKATEKEIKDVVNHEVSHLKQWHFVDLALTELATVIFWFNPVIWLFEYSVKEVHEFLADKAVLKQGAAQGEYQALLINQVFGGPIFSITNPLNKSLIKKRIIMMTKLKSPRWVQFKTVLYAPLIFGIIWMFNHKPGFAGVSDVSSLRQEYETIIESFPEYPGGKKALQEFIQMNLNYPENARKKGISGTVSVSFLVNKEGKVENIKIIKGIDAECDKEALRIAGLLSGWAPGKQRGNPVDVKVILPVEFQLENTIANENPVFVNGKIIDSKTGKPLKDAVVVIKGTNIGTIANDKGEFALEVPAENNQLVISAIGYSTVLEDVGKNRYFNIELNTNYMVIDFSEDDKK